MKLASKAETAKTKQRMPHMEILTYEGRMIQLEVPEGSTFMGAGLRDQILFDQHSPTQLLAHQIAFSLDADSGEDAAATPQDRMPESEN